jgi:hypothetical protein
MSQDCALDEVNVRLQEAAGESNGFVVDDADTFGSGFDSDGDVGALASVDAREGEAAHAVMPPGGDVLIDALVGDTGDYLVPDSGVARAGVARGAEGRVLAEDVVMPRNDGDSFTCSSSTSAIYFDSCQV